MTGRNEDCPCGSGKKYKKCHGQSNQSAPAVDSVRLLEQGRLLLQQRRFNSAWALATQLSTSIESCKLQVDILIARLGAGDLDTASRILEVWKMLDATDLEPCTRSLEIALNTGNTSAVQDALKKLQRAAPNHPRTLYYQGLLAQLDGKLDVALDSFTLAARQQYPDFTLAAWPVLAATKAVEIAKGKYPGSTEQSFSKLLGAPDVVAALQTSLEQWDESQANQPQAPTAEEQSVIANAWCTLASAGMQGIIDTQACQAFNRKALELNPQHDAARASDLFALNYDAELTAGQIYQRHIAAGDWWAKSFPQRKRKFFNRRQADRTLRVGYLSSDFCRHPVAYFILPVLLQHDARKVRSYLYYTKQKQDEFTQRCADAADEFVHVWDFDEPALASRIERDDIDLLVDLNGPSNGGKLILLAQRAAPVQINWLGYPNTTGLPTVDYRIVDQITDPPESGPALCREKLLYMPRLFSVYSPIEEPPPVAPSAYDEKGFITFGSFNNVNKLNCAHLARWAKILQQVPNSRLLFKYPSLDFQSLQNQLRDLMLAEGLPSERIEFLGNIPTHHGHLEAFSRIDIHLDSFPYQGTTTTCESLLMGVPVVSLTGDDHRSRVAASLLNSVGHPEWIANNEDEYVRIAVDLARDPKALAATRGALRNQLQGSALMDAKTFTAELEQAYRSCWEDWCRQSGPIA
ncbi:MAG: SEC-C metal-binding domain-containing protein [Xanthomonadales bacterium]|nr:SEC-C metal-binding domain-containing protein [Xanthomonadales bacterium]